MNNRIIGVYNTACMLTLFGAASSVVAIFLALNGIIDLALIGLIVAGLADLFDGVIARRLQRNDYEKEFGVQLDTTVDVVAFIATPVVIGLKSSAVIWISVFGSIFFVIAGTIRLAHFNTLSVRGNATQNYHLGLPVTYTALIFPLLFTLRDLMTPESFSLIIGASFIAIGFLFVINVPVRKPRGIFYIILPLLAVILAAYWAGHYLNLFGAT